MSDALAPVLERIDTDRDAALRRLTEYLRIPSIGTDPAYNEHTRRAAQWAADQLTSMGFDAAVRTTPGQPMVVARAEGPKDAPTLLYYGHYDVQPPDPLDLWDSPPFDPVLVDAEHGKRIVARGANDDKGQSMAFFEAFRAWKAVHRSFPVTIKVLLEGEEESGSPSLDPFLEANKAELAADVAVISDSEAWDINTPAVTYMLRDLVYLECTLHGPSHDLHSGMYGGGVVNPINALTKILGALHDENGVVQIPGFYDDVIELSEVERKQWESLGYDEKQFLAGAGLKTPTGEKGRTILERLWSRPTCDINGIWGGYTGEGAKTVIPAHASAKISCRLVADQDPRKVHTGLEQFLHERTPPDCRFEIKTHGLAPAIRVPTDSKFLQVSLDALKRVYGKEAVLMGCGGSIPVVGSIQRILGFDSLLVGLGLEDDRIHSPNEKFELRCFEMGIKSHAAILDAVGRLR